MKDEIRGMEGWVVGEKGGGVEVFKGGGFNIEGELKDKV